jgi:curved DNA-binding protein CbpA
MTEERDPYAVLGVPSTASQEDVVTAYRAQARRHHPDISVERDAERRMAEINAAWSILRDPARREAWDRANEVARAAPSGPIDARTRDRAATSGAGPGAPPPRTGPRQGGVAWRRGPGGEGAAGPPPGNPRGSVLPFGRHIGWSIGEIARVDPGYLAWLQPRREGEPYREEIDRSLAALRATPGASEPAPARKRGRFR